MLFRSGYAVPPYVTVSCSTPNTSSSANARIDALDVRAYNYKSIVTVNTSTDSVGHAYGLSVSSGVIYQKGYFSRVSEGFLVVEKYSNNTNKYVGFDTTESLINYRQDLRLYDNATGTLNYNAPGADRLKLSPTLVSITAEEAEANADFLPIIQFSEGRQIGRAHV